MPLYTLACDECELAEEHNVPMDERNNTVLSCGHVGRVFHRPQALIFFKEGWYEHITTEPLYIKSKDELRRACEEHGVTSVYLEDSC